MKPQFLRDNFPPPAVMMDNYFVYIYKAKLDTTSL